MVVAWCVVCDVWCGLSGGVGVVGGRVGVVELFVGGLGGVGWVWGGVGWGGVGGCGEWVVVVVVVWF